jgi:hypothetical protein
MRLPSIARMDAEQQSDCARQWPLSGLHERSASDLHGSVGDIQTDPLPFTGGAASLRATPPGNAWRASRRWYEPGELVPDYPPLTCHGRAYSGLSRPFVAAPAPTVVLIAGTQARHDAERRAQARHDPWTGLAEPAQSFSGPMQRHRTAILAECNQCSHYVGNSDPTEASDRLSVRARAIVTHHSNRDLPLSLGGQGASLLSGRRHVAQ